MSEKLSREELLRILLHMFKCYEYNFINKEFKPPEEGKQAYNQMRKLIQRKVGRKFVEKWIDKLYMLKEEEESEIDTYYRKIYETVLTVMFKELGMEVDK